MFIFSIHNVAFARLLAQIIHLRAQFPYYFINKFHLDNAGEFSSQSFINYCMSIGINDIEHPITHIHTQNSLVESLIKKLQLIVQLLFLKTQLPLSVWGHAILHIVSLIRL